MPESSKDDLEKTEIRIPLAKGEDYPSIEVIVGPRQGVGFPLPQGVHTIGRAAKCLIRLDDSSVSRRHAVLTLEEGVTRIEDEGSKNGTLVNGRRVREPTPLQNGDLIKVGIVILRYLTAPAAESPTIEQIEQASHEVPLVPQAVAGGLPAPAPGVVRRRAHPWRWRLLIGGGVALVILGAGLFLFSKWYSPPIEVQETQRPGGVLEGGSLEPTPSGEIPLFVEWTTHPLPGKVFLEGEMIGTTPIQINRLLKVGRTYESRVVFKLEEIGKTLEYTRPVTPRAGDQLIPIDVEASVGVFKILSLPRDVVAYLEGTFADDPNTSHPVRLTGVAYGKPIYLPFGSYVLELKARQRVGTSEAFIDTVVYRREFALQEEVREWTVEAIDEDLTRFPVWLTSVPPKAKVFLDGEEKGETPLETFFPVGMHELKMIKEGYFDYVESINVLLNTPYEAQVVLQTSEAGTFINEARGQMARGAMNDAKTSLAEALKKGPTPREVAEIHFLMGRIHLLGRGFKEAEAHFEQARKHPDFEGSATVGLAEAVLSSGQKDRALQLITEVLVGSEDPDVRRSAGEVFSKISPFKSVIYANSEPQGAELVVNGTPLGQKTPVILHDLGAGTYRLLFRLPGYRAYQVRVNLAVSEFKPVTANLETEPLP